MVFDTESALSHSVARRLTDLLPLFGILAAISYAVLRLAYLQFYYSFMVAPEEVGLGQAELLTQSLVAPLLLLVVIILGVLITESLLDLTSALFRPLAKPLGSLLSRLPKPFKLPRFRNKTREVDGSISGEAGDSQEMGIEEAPKNTSRNLKFEVGFTVAVVSLSFLTVLFRQADSAVTGVRDDGYTITTVHFPIGPVNIPFLNVIAWPSTVEWKDSANKPSSLERHPDCIMYLGKADGTTVIYDVKTRMTTRFKSDDAIVAVYPFKARLAPSCYE